MTHQQNLSERLAEIRNETAALDAKLWTVAGPVMGFSQYGYRKGTPSVLGRTKRRAARMETHQLVALLLACSDEMCERFERNLCSSI